MTDGKTGLEQSIEQLKKDHQENFDLHEAFSTEVWALWVKYQRDTTMDAIRFQRVTAQSLMTTAATLAVDCHQTEEQFAAVAQACFRVAYAKAPKFT